MDYFEAGKRAKAVGKTVNDNPFIIGYTKLGAPKLSEPGLEWERGFYSVPRKITEKELADCRKMDISRFKRKSNRYYAS